MSQNTVVVCPEAVAVGGAEYGGGCFLFQLGRMGILSCLQRFLSGRWRAFISRHRILFFSMVSIMVASPHSHGIWNGKHQHQHQCIHEQPISDHQRTEHLYSSTVTWKITQQVKLLTVCMLLFNCWYQIYTFCFVCQNL